MQSLRFTFTTRSVAKSRRHRSALMLCSLRLVRLRSGWVSLPDGCNILADTKAISDRPSLGPSGCALTECPTPTGCLQWQNTNKPSPAALQHVNYQAGRQTHIYTYITNTQTGCVIQPPLYDVSSGGSELHQHTCISAVPGRDRMNSGVTWPNTKKSHADARVRFGLHLLSLSMSVSTENGQQSRQLL